MRYIKYVILVWIVIQSSFLKAQQYPVDVQLFVTPPYQQSLRDYWATFEPKMQVYLLLKDLNSPIRNVALGFSLENVQGQPLAQTPNFLQPFQTQLTSGVRKTLSNIELKPLFAFENLQGVSEHFYNDLLPEGAYFMCFTAYDVATQTPLSAKARTLIQIRRYTPPLPTLPAKGEIISKKNQFQHLVFQWMLRDPAPFTQYEFTLKEVWDNNLSPDEAFISGRLVYQGNIPSNTILYGPDKPILLENKRYVWKIRAFTQNPNNPNQRQSFFHNEGNSETFYFDYVSHCEAPKFLTAITKDNTANIRWITEPVRANTHSGENGGFYKILYREKGKNWKSQMSNHPQATLIGLRRGRNYVYKVGVACGLGQQTQGVFGEQTYLYSTEQEFVTPHKQNDSTSVQCGVKPEIRIRNREPLQEVLGVNETFVAGDFPVTIIRATGSNGVFSGEGYVQVPYLLDTKIKVKFDGIKINSERQLFEGKLVTTYDKTESNVIEIKSWEEVENAVAESLKAQEQIIKEVTDLEKKYAENKLNSQEFQREIEEKNKKWQEEILKTSKIIDFVVTSPAILIPERKELLEQQKELSKNINLDKENLKKVKEKTKQIAQISKNVKKKHQNNVAESKKKLEEFAKKQNICGEWIAKKGKFGRVQIDYIAYQECTYGTLFRLENNVYIYQTNYNLYQTTWSTELGIERFYIYASDLKTWVEFVPENRKFHRGEMPEMMKDIIFGVADFWIPLEDGTVLLTGKNFDREEKSRVVAAGLFVFNISAGKVVKLVKGTGKVIGKGAKYLGNEAIKVVGKEADKALKILKGKADDILKSGLDEKAIKATQEAITKREISEELLEELAEEIGDIATKKRKKISWEEVKALFKRGNDFNKKAEKSGWYDFNEVHLENGKRLDSYNPDLGEIVSRKATDLENIKLSTFENYLKEMKNKYSVGTKIRSNKYKKELDGKTLKGQQILEIPESNKKFDKIQEYIDLAKNKYNIEIRFRPE